MDADAAAAVDEEEEEGETYTLGHTLQTNGAGYRQKIRNALQKDDRSQLTKLLHKVVEQRATYQA